LFAGFERERSDNLLEARVPANRVHLRALAPIVEPAATRRDALEDSEVLYVSEADIDDLYERIPKFERFFRILTQNALAAHQARIVSILSLQAKARYAEFCRLYPSLIDCLPQKQVASYIGVTPEFLSKMLRTGDT